MITMPETNARFWPATHAISSKQVVDFAAYHSRKPELTPAMLDWAWHNYSPPAPTATPSKP